jgi:nucleoside-diphosphate-sugar epimerase
MESKSAISIIGCGWLGLAVAQDLIAHGVWVKGSTTRQEKMSRLQEAGVQAFLFDTASPRDWETSPLWQAQQLLITIPPSTKDPLAQERYPQLIAEVAKQAQQAGVQHIIYTSTTGVYPNTNDWVSEATPPAPQRASAQAAWAAEEALGKLEGVKVSVLRLAGLTGPDRPAGRFLAGKKGLSGAEVPVNLVHLADVIGVIRKLVDEPGQWGVTLNVCASGHPTRSEFYPERARLLGLEPPTFDEEQMRPPFKKVSNKKLTHFFGYSLQYPDPKAFPVG